MNNLFFFSDTEVATANRKMDNEACKNMWCGFCLGGGELFFRHTDDYCFILGCPSIPVLSPEKEFVIHVDADGAVVIGRDYNCLVRGFLCLLMRIEYIGDRFALPFFTEVSDYRLKNRMLHICIFPENDLLFIKKLIRFSALCQYTHIVIEFWGMLKYDCLKELSWPQAFTKTQTGELIMECKNLGIELVPMFNMLGHASASRGCYGKHVVLDQNPRLQNLFTPDGWAWNIKSDEVVLLLKKVRRELYDLFGQGDYIHIGCDEAYYISKNETLRHYLPTYIGNLTSEIEKEGRRPMLWMDMLLEKEKFNKCYCVGEPRECGLLRSSTAKSTIFVDWQYDCHDIPVPSLLSLKNCGHEAIGAPWLNNANYKAHIQTVEENGMFGIMLTTWHILKDNFPNVLGCAKELGAKGFAWSEFSSNYEETATLLRRVSFEGNTYSDAGWSKEQIEV